MNRTSSIANGFVALGAFNLALAVALGAAGMHAFKAHLAANDPAGWFQIALHYHQLHALGLIVLGLAMRSHAQPSRWLAAAGWLLFVGILLFSGNLYLRSIAGFHTLHAFVPFGGSAFILGWLAFGIGAFANPTRQN
jgi:uncharacterized membrane protein YgdD (TMEM256/DUF423 family)